MKRNNVEMAIQIMIAISLSYDEPDTLIKATIVKDDCIRVSYVNTNPKRHTELFNSYFICDYFPETKELVTLGWIDTSKAKGRFNDE